MRIEVKMTLDVQFADDRQTEASIDENINLLFSELEAHCADQVAEHGSVGEVCDWNIVGCEAKHISKGDSE